LPELSLVDEIIETAASKGYHPRSDKQSGAQSKAIVRDLLDRCPLMRSRAESGELVVKLTHHQRVGHENWKIDIAFGTSAARQPPLAGSIAEAPPVLIQIAIELKSIWTEHNKAMRNRFRDFSAFHGHAHRYNENVVAGAFLVVNASDRFYSPLNANRPEAVTRHGGAAGNGKSAARKAIDLFRSIHLRNTASDLPGLEALGVVVVEHDNFILMPPELRTKYGDGAPSRAIAGPPAPQMGDPLHYETFLQRICEHYRTRFG
jgi:hypothetical protein